MLVTAIIMAVLSPILASYAVGFVNQEEFALKIPLIKLKKGLHYIGLYIFLPVFYILFYLLRHIERIDLYFIQCYILIFFMAVIAIVDFEHKKIPNTVLIYMLAAWILSLIPQIALDFNAGVSLLAASLLGALTGGGFFLLAYIISRKSIGGGDVKLMAVIGLYVTVYRIFPVMFYGMLAASLVGLILILLKKINRKDTMPLSPFLFLGVCVTLLFMN